MIRDVQASREELATFFGHVLPHLNEKQRRLVAGAMASALGHGGQSAVAQAAGISRHRVIDGVAEIKAGVEVSDRQRAPGGGSRTAAEKQPGLVNALLELVKPETRGDPTSSLLWTLKSTYELADELIKQGFKVSAELVRRLLHQQGYSLQATSKQNEGTTHPDRNAQFIYLDQKATSFLDQGQPVISVDTKKKELIGDFANKGAEWQPKGQPERVRVHDFIDKQLGKAIPYGVYDVAHDEGWVSVGNTADTAQFAVASIRQWWQQMGSIRFPDATKLMITADAGGSNGYRVRAWKYHLGQLARETGLEITVCHYPPGTSKWNKIEHRLFSFITINWRGRPLTSIRTVVELIAATGTKTGLVVQSAHDSNVYEKGVKVSDTELAAIPLTQHEWHGEWNYTIAPNDTKCAG